MSFEKYDLSKLENVRRVGNKIICGCCACIQEGKDHDRTNMVIFSNGAFGCITHEGDKEHNRQIYNYLYRGEDFEIEEQEEFIYRGTKLKYYPEELLQKLIPDYNYWINRGIPPQIVSQFDGGLASKDEKGKLQGRYVFAIRNKDDKIVGWAGRLIEYSNFSPKWKNIGNKKQFIFPARKLSEQYIKEKKQVVVLESVGDALSCYKYGIKNIIVLFGVVPSSQLISYIISLGVKEIIISTNNDSAKNNVGNEAAEKIKRRLSLFFNSEGIKIILPSKKDWNESDEQEILEFKKKLEVLQNGGKVE